MEGSFFFLPSVTLLEESWKMNWLVWMVPQKVVCCGVQKQDLDSHWDKWDHFFHLLLPVQCSEETVIH